MAYAIESDNYRSKRSYIATAAFNGSIYQYTTQLNTTNFKNEGKLTAITTLPSGTAVSSSNCPVGRILREVGRKLYPGNNPGLQVGETYNGAVVGTTATNHYWVLVYDNETGLRGYIDPNATIFAVYNSDKSLEFTDALENAGGTPLSRLGSPVYTAGNITTTAGNVVATAGSVTAGTTVTAGTGLTITTGPFIQSRPAYTITDGASMTLGTANLIGGINTGTVTQARAVTLPITSAIITALGSVVGASSEFVFWNSAAFNATLTQGDSSTTFQNVSGSPTTAVVNASLYRFLVVVTGASTVVIYRTT